MNAVFPAERWARVEVVLTSGQVLKSADTVAHGSMETPLSDQEISDKFQGLMTAPGAAHGHKIEAQVTALETCDLGALMDAITQPLSPTA